MLCEMLNVRLPGKDRRPLHTVIELFKFRNTLAHGRTLVLEPDAERIDPEHVDEHLSKRLLTDWEKLIQDASFAKLAREDVEALVMAMHAARPEPKERHPFVFGFGSSSAVMEDA